MQFPTALVHLMNLSQDPLSRMYRNRRHTSSSTLGRVWRAQSPFTVRGGSAPEPPEIQIQPDLPRRRKRPSMETKMPWGESCNTRRGSLGPPRCPSQQLVSARPPSASVRPGQGLRGSVSVERISLRSALRGAVLFEPLAPHGLGRPLRKYEWLCPGDLPGSTCRLAEPLVRAGTRPPILPLTMV